MQVLGKIYRAHFPEKFFRRRNILRKNSAKLAKSSGILENPKKNFKNPVFNKNQKKKSNYYFLSASQAKLWGIGLQNCFFLLIFKKKGKKIHFFDLREDFQTNLLLK